MGDKIAFRLQIPVKECVILHLEKLPVRVRHIDSMGQVVGGISRKKSGFFLVIDLFIVLLLRGDAHIQIHKIQPAVAVHIVGKMLRVKHAEPIPQILRDTSGRHIEKQLISKPEALLCLDS